MADAVQNPVVKRLQQTHLPAQDLERLLDSIHEGKRSGLLEVYFNQGSPNGTLKFTERQK